MKRFFILFILIFFGMLSVANADNCGNCQLKNGTPDILKKYIENLNKVRSNINSQINSQKSDDGKLSQAGALTYFSQALSPELGFDDYYDDFKYFMYGAFNNVPSEIKRDLKLLNNEHSSLQNMLERLVKKGASNTVITSDKICNGIPNCNISGNAIEVITQLVNNNKRVIMLYKNSIIGNNSKVENIYLVDDNFYNEFIKIYNKDTAEACSECEGGFTQRATERITNMAKKMTETEDFTEYWKEAFDLLTGETKEEDRKKLEKDLLQKELSRQGVKKEHADIILGNLAKYQEGGNILENNFITNSLVGAGSYIIKKFDSYGNAIMDIFKTSNPGGTDTKDPKSEINVLDIPKNYDKNEQTMNLYSNMQKQYIQLLEDSQTQTVIDEKAIVKLINIHTTFAQINKNLYDTFPKSEVVCKRQCKGYGNCDNY